MAENNARETSVPATSGSESFWIDVHVANDGVGVRLRSPAKKGRKIEADRSIWQWMAIGAPKVEDQERWVDWTQLLGYEYYLVDEGWADWKDAWLNLAAVTAYAQSHHVKIWLWVHSNEVKDAEARRAYFRKAVEAGVVGVKIDFPSPCNRWWSNWYYDTARDAADFKLLVDFHGANKPTGFERTWPNVLSREGVRGHENHMTRYGRTRYDSALYPLYSGTG